MTERLEDSNLDVDIAVHAQSISAIDVPSNELRVSILNAFKTGRVQPKPDEAQAIINEHLASWIGFSNKVMPPPLVARFIRQHADNLAPFTINMFDGRILLPPWRDESGPDFASPSERAGVSPKFTKKETLDYLGWIDEHPEVPVATTCVQQLIAFYIGRIQPHFPNHEEDFLRFQLHWATASNMSSMIGTALFHTKGNVNFDREHIERAFDFLIESDAFRLLIPAARGVKGVPPLTFACPVQGQLRAIADHEGALSDVLDVVRKNDLSEARTRLMTVTHLLRQLINTGGFRAYREIYVSSLDVRHEF